ncbi:MAG: imidazolonepropionase [Cytophagales bacterium]|nr:MAG: imidazolonepropionase [Cytophagales bacterium]TAF61392.1 MAG: imidazolonepropionase [Cytophagales bacterium]
MTHLLIHNIKGLVQASETLPSRLKGSDMKKLPVIDNAFLWIENGLVREYGHEKHLPESLPADVQRLDAGGGFVLPTFVDSHTHIVYAGSREDEFVDKIKGLSYVEIAQKGGGILNSAQRLRQTSPEELYVQAEARLRELLSFGVGAVEIKSGYGLSTESELKMLRVVSKLKKNYPLVQIKATFLGAHAFPKEVEREVYVRSIVEDMLPAIAQEGLADYCDVFCDKGFFTVDECRYILQNASRYGLKPKIHANELDFSGGIQAGVAEKAISVDHLEFTGEEEITALLNSQTIPTLLPSTAFYLGFEYPPARLMLDADLPVALASDYNPGSSPSGNMLFVLSLACIKMKMTPEEAINAATINAAAALELEESAGCIRKGRRADFFITKPIPSLSFIPYSFGSRLVAQTFLKGQLVYKEASSWS